MSIHVALHHRSVYRFDRSVTLSPHEIRLRPAAHARTPILSYSLQISPSKHFVNWQQDVYGNYVARAVFPNLTRDLSVTVDLVAEMAVINPFDFFVERYAECYPFRYPDSLAKELVPFLETAESGPHLLRWLQEFRTAAVCNGTHINDFLVTVNQRVQHDIAYLLRMQPGVQSCEQTLDLKSGSCRDSAWLMVNVLRHLGIAARFVSGYLIQLVADIKSLDGPTGPQADFTDLHAWAEAYIPGAGWIGLDPTSGLLTGEGHIPLACTAVPGSAAPIIGMTDVCEATFEVSMTVTRLREDPRVTKPYSVEQWNAIVALGHAVDAQLQAGDVRLTQGGEPTFVSVDDMNGDEWNFTALSPVKLKLARDLRRRLQRRFAPGALLHFAQGKWYPGEPLPRWALGVYWRIDGTPIWRDPSLLVDDVNDDVAAGQAGCTDADALRFATRLAERLGFNRQYLVPAYEDVRLAIVEEERLPFNFDVNIDPQHEDLTALTGRARLVRLLRRGLGHVAGYVLPLRASIRKTPQATKTHRRPAPHDGRPDWQSSCWPLKSQHLYLLPGDSPAGFRLPLDALPEVDAADVETEQPRDPFEPRPPLADFATLSEDLSVRADPPPPNPAPKEVVRTALCIEVREAQLHVFMPPLPYLEDYLALVTTLEETARELRVAIAIEGYPPPADARIKVLNITPDPGVIEVNIHPARSWDELVTNTTILYDEARLARLAAEKFMLDGRHTGTGGGNHITLGGANVRDSPLLRRPDLLKSLVCYWQNHPALSYFFAGMFVGPTSQAPRVDEARDDNLYELEIAFQQMAEKTATGVESETPWLVDRLLRNLLVDLTGNTHRAEFCIDKLYAPAGPNGRLGLLEFRAFEMPPHAQMSLTEMLLLRALLVRFWRTPYAGELVRWGTQLHDRFMLPHFLVQDLNDIVRELNAAGYAFESEWFAPFLEFRFPRYGSVVYAGIQLELRQAIEPWNVLGEDMQAGSTARYVDSSVERLQVKVTGMADPRHVVTCNGRALPLQPTGVQGEFVAGVRYRAWDPPSALHPTIAPHAPLTFDIVDTWSGRAIGGCTYHVSHPGGRSYETFPVNANEAEARRAARFWPHGHTPGTITVVAEAANRNFPFTLDLRRSAV